MNLNKVERRLSLRHLENELEYERVLVGTQIAQIFCIFIILGSFWAHTY